MSEAETKVLQAACKWLETKEAMLAADESRHDPVETAHQLDDAEYELTGALYGLLGREPLIPKR